MNTLGGVDNRVVTTVRLPADLAARAKEYAKHREVTLTVLLEAGLRNLLHDAQGGVPELEQASAVDGAGRASAAPEHHPVPPAPARASVEAPHVASVREMQSPVPVGRSEWERMMRARQGRLNRGKG